MSQNPAEAVYDPRLPDTGTVIGGFEPEVWALIVGVPGLLMLAVGLRIAFKLRERA